MSVPRSLGPLFAPVLALVVAAPLAAAPLPDGVVETSFTAVSGGRVMELSIDVPASAQEVWDAWATTEGFRSWAAPFAIVESRPGGVIESSYDPQAKPGDRNNIRNEIVSLVPLRLLVIRNVQAPEKVPFDAATFQRTVTAIGLTPLGETSTRVTVANSGYPGGEASDGVYEFFRNGNAWTLAQLRKRFEQGPTDWTRTAPPQKSAKP